MTTKIKICGITDLEDALFAIECGADALGFVFYAKSPRYVSTTHARVIIQQLPPFVSVFGLCVNADSEYVKEIISTGVNILQFHGDESAAFCQQFNFPFVKAIRVRSNEDIIEADNQYPEARALLLDSYDQNLYGGSGMAFDWSMIPESLRNKVIVAGGLNADNVVSMLEGVKPLAVDVSSGVEVQKGVKSHEKIQAFCDAVRRFDCHLRLA